MARMNLLPYPLGGGVPRWGALVLVLVMGLSLAGASDRAATLEAIRNLENPRNLTRPGPRGELGAYQFRSDTWRMHTTLPFAQATDRATSDRLAVAHYEWIRRGLEKARLPVTPYNVALAWNGGLAAVVRGTSPRAAHRYAERAANLAAVLHEEQRVAMGR
jgi:hypothetical protein